MATTGPSVKLLLDTGHATFAGADPAAPGPAAPRPHRACPLQGCPRRGHAGSLDNDWSFLDAVVAGVFTVPGDGSVDFAAVLRELPGYDGGWWWRRNRTRSKRTH